MAWRKTKSRRRASYGYGYRDEYGYRDWEFPRDVPAAERRAQAARRIEKLKKRGVAIDPVKIDGSVIARTFWGKEWCDHLESHSDFANRLPRGQSYVRNGSVCDLKIEPGRISSRVAGNDLYEVAITIRKLPAARWAAIRRKCAGGIASVIELLQGRLSTGVMKIITDRENGLFPRPAEIEMDCSCPDWATMCKHVAATLYGVGARLDDRPELLFVLRGVDHEDLLSERTLERLAEGMKTGAETAKSGLMAPKSGRRAKRSVDGRVPRDEAETLAEIAESDLSEVFGVDIAPTPAKRKKSTHRTKRRAS
jgi:uncharacterized Zn finger protein